MMDAPRFDNDIEQLKAFYDVATEQALIEAMNRHIKRLQDKLSALLPPEPAVRHVRT